MIPLLSAIDVNYSVFWITMKHIDRFVIATFLALVAPRYCQSGEVFRLFYRFGFGEGNIGDPDSTPSQSDIEGLICATNEFLSDSMQNYTKNDAIQIYATEISWGFDDWIYNGSEPEAPRNVPVIVNFTAVTATTDGTAVPSNNELWQGTKYFDYVSYLMNYIWKIEGQNFFTKARGLWYEPFISEPVAGSMAESSQCPGAPSVGK